MPLVVPASVLSTSDTDMVLDVLQPPLHLFSPVAEEKVVNLGLSSSKLLTSKVGSLESKMVALETVNSSSFVILGGNFNENGSGKSASFKFCLGLDLANTFDEHLLVKASIWCNFRGVEKVINFILVSENLASTIASHKVDNMSEFFNTDHKLVSVLIELDELLDAYLTSIHRQAN
ncbi:hypothetical protein G9A89_006464 [Geosiphon pyriformis]|nr:hypothetical protein G9A89_006464 [Geosiphon pyriformis]